MLQLLGPSTGGIRAHVVALTTAMRDRGWAVTVAGPAGVLDGSDGVALDHVVDVSHPLRARSTLADPVVAVDVVHAHGLKAAWVASTLRPRPPLVATVHNLVLDDVAGRTAPFLRVLESALPRRVDAVLAVSSAIARRFSGVVGADVVRVVPPLGPTPVVNRPRTQVRADLGLGGDDALVVTVARLHPQKGLDDLLVAAVMLRARRPASRVFVFGEGPLESSLRTSVAELGLGGTVTLAGPRPALFDELAAADIVVIPSRWESGPLVLFEAMALGRPVVCTPVGAAPELVVDGRTGRLVPVGDSAALAAAVEDLLDDPAGAARMGQAGRQRVEAWLGRDRVEGVEAAYHEVLAR